MGHPDTSQVQQLSAQQGTGRDPDQQPGIPGPARIGSLPEPDRGQLGQGDEGDDPEHRAGRGQHPRQDHRRPRRADQITDTDCHSSSRSRSAGSFCRIESAPPARTKVRLTRGNLKGSHLFPTDPDTHHEQQRCSFPQVIHSLWITRGTGDHFETWTCRTQPRLPEDSRRPRTPRPARHRERANRPNPRPQQRWWDQRPGQPAPTAAVPVPPTCPARYEQPGLRQQPRHPLTPAGHRRAETTA